MMKAVFALLFALVFSIGLVSPAAVAQDESAVESPAPVAAPAAPEALTDSQFTYGTVVSCSAQTMKISEYDFETDTSEDVTYDVAPDVKMENVKSISDIKEGDEVEIEYLMKDGKRTAVSVYVE